MATLDTIAPEAKEHAIRIGRADLVVALPACHTREELHAVVDGLRPLLPVLLPNQKTVILHPDMAAVLVEGNDAPFTEDAQLQLFPYPLSPVERFQVQSLDQSFHILLQVGKTLGARACVMVRSATSPEDLLSLADPVLHQGYDLAVPLYNRQKFESLINAGILYPLARAVYGARLHYPLATDLALSAKLADLCQLPSAVPNHSQSGWPTTMAVCGGLQVCQVRRSSAPPPIVADPAELSASIAMVLGGLFSDVERNAAYWQKVRGSHPVRTFGQSARAESESAKVNVRDLIETFQRGCTDLLDIWAIVLSPATLLELKKLSKIAVAPFHLPDALWVHTLYDFILGYRQRVISREHLLRAMTPIYLGWVASYALEVHNLSSDAVENRLEKLCLAFEDLKPYLVSRWRWPDRFNP